MSATLTPNYIVGAAIAVSVGSSLAFCKSGKTSRNANAIKCTNARSAGYQQFKGGNKGATVSLELVYNADSPLSIVEGSEITLIVDTLGYETSEGLANPSSTPAGRLITMQVLITGVDDAWDSDGDYGVTIAGNSTGPYAVVDTATGATSTT
jgi:hypothetical protein